MRASERARVRVRGERGGAWERVVADAEQERERSREGLDICTSVGGSTCEGKAYLGLQ